MRCLGQDGAGSLAALKHMGRAEKQYNAFREEEGGTKKMERRMDLEVEGKERRRDGSGARSAAGREKERRSRDRGGMG